MRGEGDGRDGGGGHAIRLTDQNQILRLYPKPYLLMFEPTRCISPPSSFLHSSCRSPRGRALNTSIARFTSSLSLFLLFHARFLSKTHGGTVPPPPALHQHDSRQIFLRLFPSSIIIAQVKLSFSGTGEAAFGGVALFAHPDVACRCEAGYFLDVGSAPVRTNRANDEGWRALICCLFHTGICVDIVVNPNPKMP